MAYSSEEIQAAVEKLVRASIRKPLDRVGIRQVDVQFDDIREVAAGVFITYPEAPFSVLSLGCDRLYSEVSSLIVDLDSLISKVELVANRTYPISDISSLYDASNALLELETAMGSRQGNTKDPTTLPAYLRFSSSSLKYLEHIGGNVKVAGDVVETPNQAKLLIPSLFKSIMDGYSDVLEKQSTLRAGVEDYSGMRLPAKVTQAVVQRARNLLQADQADLAGMSEDQRLEIAREKTLNIITARAVVDAYVRGQQITESPVFSGSVSPFADDNHQANPAVATGDVVGPFPLLSYPVPKGSPPDARDNNVLEFTVEGSVVRVILPTALLAFLIGTGRPQVDQLNPGLGKVFTFYRRGPATGVWPDGRGYAENFNGNEDKPAVWYFPPDNNILYVEQFVEGWITTRFTIDFMSGVAGTDFVPSIGNPYPFDQPWTAYKVQRSLADVVAMIQTALLGSYIRATGIALGTDPLELTNVKIECVDPIDSLLTWRVGIRIPSVLVGGVETNTAAQSPLGFILGLEMLTKRLSAPQLVTWVEASTSEVNPSLAALPRDSKLSHMRGWTNVMEKAGVILAKWTGTASVVESAGSITATIPTGYPSLLDMGVVVGDLVGFPRQYVKDGLNFVPMTDEKALYRVTAVSASSISAVHVSGPTAETYLYRNLDIGWPEVLTRVQAYDVVEIYTAPNDGGYEILSVDSYSPFRVRIGVMLSQTQQVRESFPVELELSAGPASIAFASADLTTLSEIEVGGSARPLFFTTAPDERGTTEYVRLPDRAPKLAIGDKLRFRESLALSYERVVKNVEGRVLTLDGVVPSEVIFTAGGRTPPSVTVLSGSKASFDTFELNLATWDRTQPVDAGSYEANTNALLNPLLANPTPPLGKVADAKSALQVLRAKLVALGVELQAQVKTVIGPVNDLVNTLKDKGCDRGVDLLLEGRFSEFFGLDMDEMSYAGKMQKTAREVAREDLAQSKFGTSRIQRRVLSVQQDTDPDYDHSDSDALVSPPDQVSGLDLISSPDRG